MSRTTFLVIERALLPCPPKTARPYWCLANTLIFYNKKRIKVWEQKIPEADLRWIKGDKGFPVFDKYFSSEVFFDKYFGWQLRLTISHQKAKFWHEKILKNIIRFHKLKKRRGEF